MKSKGGSVLLVLDQNMVTLKKKKTGLDVANCCCSAAILHGRKKSSNDLFDVTVGSFDGAETCELVGCYLLSLLTDKYSQSIGLYRDDGLAAFNKTPKKFEKIRKELCKIFRENDLKITMEANKTIVNFLDITLDL